jgi:hypothetical protein
MATSAANVSISVSYNGSSPLPLYDKPWRRPNQSAINADLTF